MLLSLLFYIYRYIYIVFVLIYLSSVYNPHAHRFVDEFAADQPLKEKTEAEKKEAAEKKEKPREPNEKEKEVTWRSGKQMTKRTEAGYIEWVVDVDGILKSTKVMNITFHFSFFSSLPLFTSLIFVVGVHAGNGEDFRTNVCVRM